MLLATLLLVLASAFLHALWNALLKKAANIEAASMGILFVSLVVTACAVPFIPGPAFAEPRALAWALGAGCCEGLYFLTLCKALESAPLGWSYTWMRGGSVLLVWPVALLFLGEKLHPASAASVAALCTGLALMGLAPRGSAGRGSLGWAAVVGVSIAGFTLCYKLSLAHGAHPIPLFATSMCVSLPIQIAVRLLRRGYIRTNFVTTQWALVLAAGILCTASFVLYLQALTLAGAGAIATLRNTSVVFAVLFSWLLGERPTGRQWVGAALVAAGAAGLAWPK